MRRVDTDGRDVQAPRSPDRAEGLKRQEQVAAVIAGRLAGRQIVLVSNREPYVHKRTSHGVAVERPPGGLVAALDPIMQAVGGLWIAWGSGTADRETVDAADHIAVPPEGPRYLLRRVWIPDPIVETYYYGYANQALWPLCHMAVDKARFLRRYWDGYVEANTRFASAAMQEATPGAFVWLHDYHLALCPRLIRRERDDLILAHFWHIPWPAWDVFRACPEKQRRALLEGLLGADLLGFHLDRFCRTFLECVAHDLDAEVDFDGGTVTFRDHRTTVRAFPISIDVEHFDHLARSRAAGRWMDRWRARPEIGDRRVALGVDRLDYTKGIPERLRMIDRFLREHPQYRGRFVFIQKAAPSRTRIKAYRDLQHRVERLVTEINARYARDGWRPIVYLPEAIAPAAMAALYRLADVAVVSSLQDGMNLVAKEFIACQVDEHGVLLLSELAGAVEEMSYAVRINPYDEEGSADALAEALVIPEGERRIRMRAMRAYLDEHDIYWWMEEVVAATSRLLARRRETRALLADLSGLREAQRGRPLILFLDYDGTLVPLAATPEEAVPRPEVPAALTGLRARGYEVVIVSGRASHVVRDLLGLEDVVYIGNHGLEILHGPPPPVLRSAERLREQIRWLVRRIRERLGDVPGMVVEEKELSAAIHYRMVEPTTAERVRQVVSVLVGQHRPWVRLTRGRQVLEIRPNLPWDKGRAVLWWLERRFGPRWPERVLPVYIGDDRTDEDAFAALAGGGITVAVAPEGPTAASYFLRGPDEVLEFLLRLGSGSEQRISEERSAEDAYTPPTS